MLNTNELQEIKNHLEESQNPIFFFDNDVDGLCSFLLLRRAIGRGKGIAIKSFPDLKKQYLKKIEELNPDKVFILDKAEVSAEFIRGCEEKGLPIIWIDHHISKTSEELKSKTFYFNSMPSMEPTTYIAQKVFDRKEDLWLAMIGCIGDVFMPDFAEEFERGSPEMISSKLTPFQAFNSSEIGKLALMLNFGLMDTVTNVVNLVKYLFKAKNVYDLLEENQYTKMFHKRYSQLNTFLNKHINKAEDEFKKELPVLFYSYSGSISMSSEISNKLFYRYPDKLIVVAYQSAEKYNISIRGKNALPITQESIKGIEGATGGGHEEATGAMIPLDGFQRFKERILNYEDNKSSRS
jgi:single-stranded DNA-specific DHH superfamily exonuclease